MGLCYSLFPAKFPVVFRKEYLQSTYERVLLEVISGNILQNSYYGIISVYKDDYVALGNRTIAPRTIVPRIIVPQIIASQTIAFRTIASQDNCPPRIIASPG